MSEIINLNYTEKRIIGIPEIGYLYCTLILIDIDINFISIKQAIEILKLNKKLIWEGNYNDTGLK